MNQKVYIGPNVQHLGLLRNQVYLDGLPGQVKAALLEIPEIEELIVSVEELNDAIRKSRTKGEHLHRVYETVSRKAGIR